MRVEMTNYRWNADGDPSSIHHRRSIRLRGHDYARPGLYFVTLCTADRRPLFGTVVNDRMARTVLVERSRVRRPVDLFHFVMAKF